MMNGMGTGGMMLGGLTSIFGAIVFLLPVIVMVLLIWIIIAGIQTLSLFRQKLYYEVEELKSRQSEEDNQEVTDNNDNEEKEEESEKDQNNEEK